MIFLIDVVNEAIKEGKWYEKIYFIFHFYILIPATIIIAIYLIFTEYISLKIIGLVILCLYSFVFGVLISEDF